MLKFSFLFLFASSLGSGLRFFFYFSIFFALLRVGNPPDAPYSFSLGTVRSGLNFSGLLGYF